MAADCRPRSAFSDHARQRLLGPPRLLCDDGRELLRFEQHRRARSQTRTRNIYTPDPLIQTTTRRKIVKVLNACQCYALSVLIRNNNNNNNKSSSGYGAKFCRGGGGGLYVPVITKQATLAKPWRFRIRRPTTRTHTERSTGGGGVANNNNNVSFVSSNELPRSTTEDPLRPIRSVVSDSLSVGAEAFVWWWWGWW